MRAQMKLKILEEESLGIQVSSNNKFSIIKISLTCSNAIKHLICFVIQTDMLN